MTTSTVGPLGDYVLTLACLDQPGIVHRVSQKLAEHGANIVDLSTRKVGNGAYVLLLELSLPASADAEALDAELRALAGEIGVDIHLRSDDPDVL